MKNFDLTDSELVILKVAHKVTKDKWLADRLKAVISLGNGWPLEEVAEILLLDPETLRNYLKIFKEGGVKALADRKYKGRQSKLTDAQKSSLKEHLTEFTFLSVSSIVIYVKKEYGVQFCTSGMTDLLHRLGFSYKKPDIAPGRVDVQKQLDFLQKYEELRRSGVPLYSMDGCHPQHNSMPQYGWIPKGHTKTLPSNTGRKRINIQGAVNLDTHNLVSTLHETLDRYSTIELLKKIEKKHKNEPMVHVLVDNASYYHAQEVKNYLENSNIKLIFLPPYAPHLSLIERVWRHMKKSLLYNRYYPTYKDFKESVARYLKCGHKRAFKKLLVEKFHFARPVTSTIKLA